VSAGIVAARSPATITPPRVRPPASRLVTLAKVPTKEYEIRFAGCASDTVRAAFPEFDVVTDADSTLLRGNLPDQAALHATFERMHGLGLELLEMRTVCNAEEE
jgi:hypothetical protein